MLTNFLHFLAGVDRETLAACSSSEQNKYAILGTLVMIPIATASLATAFCLRFYTTDPVTILLSCLVSATVVFIVERALIASLRPKKFSFSVLMRILLALSMSMIVAELMTLAIFGKDIQKRFTENQAARYELIYSSEARDLEALKSELAAGKASLDKKERAYLDEIDGSNGTGIHGRGTSARAKERALNEEKKRYEELQARVEEDMAKATSRAEQTMSEAKSNAELGVLESLTTLHEIAGDCSLVRLALIMFHCFFLFLELMPLTIKLSFEGNQYSDVQEMMDQQRLDVLKVTSDKRGELMKLRSDAELRERELELTARMAEARLTNESSLAVREAGMLLETLKKLEKQAYAGGKSLSETNAEAFYQRLEEILKRFLDNTVNTPSIVNS